MLQTYPKWQRALNIYLSVSFLNSKTFSYCKTTSPKPQSWNYEKVIQFFSPCHPARDQILTWRLPPMVRGESFRAGRWPTKNKKKWVCLPPTPSFSKMVHLLLEQNTHWAVVIKVHYHYSSRRMGSTFREGLNNCRKQVAAAPVEKLFRSLSVGGWDLDRRKLCDFIFRAWMSGGNSGKIWCSLKKNSISQNFIILFFLVSTIK